MRSHFAAVYFAGGIVTVPGRYRSSRAAHAAARNVARTAGLLPYEFETVAAPAPSLAATIAIIIAALAPLAALLIWGL